MRNESKNRGRRDRNRRRHGRPGQNKKGRNNQGRKRGSRFTLAGQGGRRIDKRRMDQIRQLEKRYESCTAVDPNRKFNLETISTEMTTRLIDLFAPIGRGQRAMVVAPPKTGKTIILQKIAHALAQNHPDVRVICLLVDERPEEVTDFRRSVEAEVFASCSDQWIEDHVTAAEETFYEARKAVLEGEDVVVLMDSLTRMARAFNLYTESSGKTLSGGLDSAAMQRPRKFFGAARNIDRGGSLTIIATALVETGSRMDEIVFQEFKGTGNTEVCLSRKIAEQRIWPALDLNRTGTRREERLLTPEEYRKISMLRRALAPQSPLEALRLVMEKLDQYETNEEFLRSLAV